MPRTVIACYRPKPGQSEALDALTCGHFARLYEQGLVTRRLPTVMRARDGTVLEVFEWKSQAAIDGAHQNPAVLQMWGEYAAVCDYVPVASLPEAAELFSGFDSAALVVEEPAFFRVYNHVQVDARLSTSGVITAAVIEEGARKGYAGVINLLPEDNPHALAGEAGLVRAQGLQYHGIPVDFAAPSADDYQAFERTLDGLGEGQKVYIHCAANMRVSAFVAVYGTRRLGWSTERAAQHIAEVWEPNPVWRAFLDAHLR